MQPGQCRLSLHVVANMLLDFNLLHQIEFTQIKVKGGSANLARAGDVGTRIRLPCLPQV
jgi:hypothetical protein